MKYTLAHAELELGNSNSSQEKASPHNRRCQHDREEMKVLLLLLFLLLLSLVCLNDGKSLDNRYVLSVDHDAISQERIRWQDYCRRNGQLHVGSLQPLITTIMMMMMMMIIIFGPRRRRLFVRQQVSGGGGRLSISTRYRMETSSKEMKMTCSDIAV